MKSTLTLLFGLLLFSALHAQVPSYVPTDGLVGWWPFNGNANDETGNGNDGVVNGATLTEDRFGNAAACYDFNGISDFVTLPSSANEEIINSYSVSFWIYNNDSLNQYNGHEVIGDRDVYSFNHRYRLNFGVAQAPFISNSTYIECMVNNQPYTILSTMPSVDNWEHYCIIYLGSSSTLIAFKNGILIDSIFNIPFEPSVRQINIGRSISPDFPDGTAYYNGLIDDIAIYNRALTEQEIQNLYTGTTPAACTALPANLQNGLVGYWPFCGNANDESGNGNDGEVYGATLTADRFGNSSSAYSFDGVDDKIEIISDNVVSAISNAEVITLSYWAIDNGGNTERTAIGCYQLPTGGLYLVNNFNGNDDFGVAISPTGSVFNTTINNPSDIHHFVVVYDGLNVNENERLKVYIDGANSNLNYPYTIPSQLGFGASSVLFGARQSTIPNEETNFWNGSLDDIAIWDRALTEEEVQELYTLNACTFTIYDTLTVENVINVYDTLTIENIVDVYDTTYINVEIYDTLTVENIINVYDTLTIENVIDVYDTTTVVETEVVYDTLTIENIVEVYDTLTIENVIDVYDTTTFVETITVYDTLTVENVVDVYDTTYVTVTDTLIIDIPSGVGGTILNTLLLYPNPTSDQLTISYGNFAAMAGFSLSIFDNGGSAVHETNITQAQETLDISQWSAGVYQVVVYNAGGVPVETRQIVIQ
jgi:hypothetical protein